MFEKKQTKIAALTVGALGIALIGGGFAAAQTKQLKAPASPSVVVSEDDAQASAQAQATTTDPNVESSSYSVVIENKTTPDGKVIQSKKVWQNGQLVQEEEKTLDSEDAQNGGAVTIQLPNGQIAPGGLFSSEDEDDVFGGFAASPFEAIRQMEEQMRIQQERMKAQFDALRQQLGDPNAQIPGAFNPSLTPNAARTQALGKFWIGATIERVPDFLQAHLPIEENEGVWIQYVVPESPAAKAGLKKYDVLYKIDGQVISDPTKVSETIEKIGAKKVKVEFYRKGKLEKADLTIEERPANSQKGFVFGAPQQNKSFRVVRPGLIVPSDEANAPSAAQAVDPAAQPSNEAAAAETVQAEPAETPAAPEAAEAAEAAAPEAPENK